uniref:Ribonuclease P protein subunit p30-like n=1 Tax=Saccoglossus kowalevskii TaxID=10224 RepID=A0ABM0MRT0_SACKO|nr:PREDICTED: ribonuclease P protein subunit p30-like [Saccoglossus kowalevskii]
MAKFHDLNLLHTQDQNSLQESIKTLIKTGYEVVAVNHVVTSLDKKMVQNAPPPMEIQESVTAPLKMRAKTFKQLSRLTLILSDMQTYRINSDAVQSYDILAVQPTTEKLFQLACTQLDIDIIQVNMTEKMPMLIRIHPVKAALERGVYFEIVYAPAVRDSTARKNIISNALSLMFMCKGKNIIISSQAENAMEIRGPYDVANLGFLFGLNEAQSKDAVSMNCRSVLLHAETRRNTARGALSISNISDISERDAWKIKEHKSSNPSIASNHQTDEEESDEEKSCTRKKKKQKTKM